MIKKIVLLLILVVSLNGCLIYGKGKELCYVTSVEDGIFWGKVYTKTELASSDRDCYVVEKSNQELRDKLYGFAIRKERGEIVYKNHFLVAAGGNNSEIVDIKSTD